MSKLPSLSVSDLALTSYYPSLMLSILTREARAAVGPEKKAIPGGYEKVRGWENLNSLFLHGY